MKISSFSVVYRFATTYYNHDHNNYEFHYICRGSCLFEREGVIEEISKGTFLFFSPKENHHIIIRDITSPVTHYKFHLTLEERDQDLCDLLENRIKNKTVQVGSNRRIFFEEVRSRIENSSTDQQMSGSFQLLSFLYQLPDLGRGIKRAPLKDDRISGEIESLLHTMQEQIFGAINLPLLINETGYSESYLIRRFKSVTGLPPNQYYLRLKVDTAKILLTESNETIRSIATQLYFTDEFYFSRTFKKWTGMSPARFRSESGFS